MLVQTLPFPPDSGVAIRTFNVMRLLARHYDITALCFYRWKRGHEVQDLAATVTALGEFAAVRTFPIGQEHSRWRFAFDHGRSLLLGRVYTDYAYESNAFEAAVRAEVATGTYDVVHVDSLDLARYLPMLGDLPVICVHHNVESALLRRRAQVEKSRLLSWYLRRQATLMESTERRWCPAVDLNVVVSPEDAEVLRRIAARARFEVVPNGVDVEAFRPAPVTDPKSVVFVGGTTWFPNLDALEFFVGSVLPALRKRVPDVRVTWAGRSTEEQRRLYQERHGVTLTGYLKDIRPVVAAAACYVVPLRVGGGTRLKILDAWSMGKAIVSTSIGCEGLAAEDGRNILVRNDPLEFAEAIANVLGDVGLRDGLATAGRQTVERTYAWDVIGTPMAQAYDAAVTRHSAAANHASR